ncbi:3'-5' exonuclease [Hymenobacter sp. M29]|uniref:3'-5' exonuclease n=1 Tax=Hymenobacter mellowenesis TaxID=3063995 RepID=A0ABT9A9E1_9BACT|nr:3'-5' exonuclease [Hymenobacter sp. M29]MDO7846461.1 3'-5' exonuclease [Hymenobacter sp. M29]
MSEAQYFQRTTSVGRGQESAEKKKCTWHTEYFKYYTDKEGAWLLCSVNECEDKTMWFSKPMPFPVPQRAQPSTAKVYAAALARYEVVAAKKKAQADTDRAAKKKLAEMRAALGSLSKPAPVRSEASLPQPVAAEPEAVIEQPAPAAVAALPLATGPQLLDDFTVIDTEFVPEGAHLLEVAAIRYINLEPREAFVSFVAYGGFLPRFVTELTGITALHLHGAPSEKKVLGLLRQYVGDSLIVCHNVPADKRIIDATRARLGATDELPNPWLCTMALARKRLPKGQGVGLADLCQHFSIRRRGEHRAKADVLMTFQVLRKLHELQPITRGELFGAPKPSKGKKNTVPAGPGLFVEAA